MFSSFWTRSIFPTCTFSPLVKVQKNVLSPKLGKKCESTKNVSSQKGEKIYLGRRKESINLKN